MKPISKNIIQLLNKKVEQYNHIDFIELDPISIPHQFTKKQDIEIAAFFAATLSWGNRKSIITSCKKLLELMDNTPFDFIIHHQTKDIKPFVHRTFNQIDLTHFIRFLQYHYKKEKSLETAFTNSMNMKDENIEEGLNGFHQYFFNPKLFPNYPTRTHKHIATPFKNSACKRLNMFLRWMVRKDEHQVDFGIWKNIKASQLIIPMDVHVVHVAHQLGLITNTKTSWQAAISLTNSLKQLDSKDPVKYDYALFSLGVVEGLK